VAIGTASVYMRFQAHTVVAASDSDSCMASQ
jgi:hypothetical protein